MENTQEPNKFLVPLAIVVAGAMVAGAIYFGGSPNSSSSLTSNDSYEEIPMVTKDDHYIGSRDAKLVIVEYSDTECPFCKTFHNTMKTILNSYPNDVAWVYRHFPIPQLHIRAVKEAEATECAAELGGNTAFWSYLDRIFEVTNSNDSLDPAELPKIATAIGLNLTQFNDCLSSNKYEKFVMKDTAKFMRLGRGTPYSVIIDKDGKQTPVSGAVPIDKLKLIIEAALK